MMVVSIKVIVACPASRPPFYEMREATLQGSIFLIEGASPSQFNGNLFPNI